VLKLQSAPQHFAALILLQTLPAGGNLALNQDGTIVIVFDEFPDALDQVF
jgi:hypothetical protein